MKLDLDEWAQSVVGKTIAEKYRVESELGRGGMGGVFLARHSILGDRRFAIKLIMPNPEMGTPEEQEKRFAREAATALTFVHARAVQVRDFGFDHTNQVMYMAMDFVEGRSLKDVVDEASAVKKEGEPPVDLAHALLTTLKILDALKAAHKALVVHRDLKPGNIMIVEKDGVEDIMVLDFGFAKVMSAAEGRDERDAKDQKDDSLGQEGTKKKRTSSRIFSEALSTANVVVGTPHYMAPEQARGSDVDRRADLYSLGVILFEMLTGVLPHSGSNAHSLLIARASAPALSLDEARPDIDYPPEVQILSEYALAHDPNDRFQNAARFASSVIEALQAIGADIPDDLIGTQRSDTTRMTALTDADFVKAEIAKAELAKAAKGPPIRLFAGIGAAVAAVVLGAFLVLTQLPQSDSIGRAQAAASLGNYDEAIEILQSTLESGPENPGAAELLRSTQTTRALMLARQAAQSGELERFRSALEDARRLGADPGELRELSDLLAAKGILSEVDRAIGERRFTQATQMIKGLPDPLPRGMSPQVAERRSKIDEALVRAEALLRALDRPENAGVPELEEAMSSLKTFLSEFPAHPKGPVVRAEIGKILTSIEALRVRTAEEARKTLVSIQTRPVGLICREGERFLGNSDFQLDDVLPAGDHIITLVDPDGFMSTHEINVLAGQTTKVFLDHAAASLGEMSLYKKVLATRESPSRLASICNDYLKAYPQGAKNVEVLALLEEAKTRAREESDAESLVAFSDMMERNRLLPSKEQIVALQAYLRDYGSSEAAPEARQRLARLQEEAGSRESVMSMLDDYDAPSKRREKAVRKFVEDFPEPEFSAARKTVLRSLLARPVDHGGEATYIARVGKSRFAVCEGSLGRITIHGLPSGRMAAETVVGSGTVVAMDGAPDGRLLVAVRGGAILRWNPGAALAEIAAVDDDVEVLLALTGDRFVAAGGKPGSAYVVEYGGAPKKTEVGNLKGRVLAGTKSEDAGLFALGTDKGEVVLLRDVPGKSPATVWRKRLDGPIASLSISPRMGAIAVGVISGGRIGVTVYAIKNNVAKELISYDRGHAWMQAVDDSGTVVIAGWLLLPSSPDVPIPVKLGAKPVVDARGQYLISATTRGKAVISYLPELIRHASAMKGMRP